MASKISWKLHPNASKFYEAIRQGWGFTARASIHEVEPGDVFAILYESNSPESGHVTFVDAKPIRVKER